ncbi:DUF5363 domain-containing protein [Glaesserella sp.]|uniref:DUF5363 domain-containing protein n=1 Tax=Glaesserella sp. TaxID=2094731 RepID=UPI00359F3E7C
MAEQQKGFFRNLLDKYDELCKDLGVDQGGCRGCIPVVKFDPEKEEGDNKTEKKE